MKQYKYCKYCRTKNDINNTLCQACTADLDPTIHKDNRLKSLILAILTALMFLFLTKGIFTSYGSDMLYVEIMLIIVLVVILYIFYKYLFSPENTLLIGWLDLIDSIFGIYSSLNSADLRVSTVSSVRNKNKNEKTVRLGNSKIFFCIVYSGVFLLWIFLWSLINVVSFNDNILALFLVLAMGNIIFVPFLTPMFMSLFHKR